MSNIVRGDGRTHIESRLMRESLQDRAVIARTDSDRDLRVFPDVTCVCIGGQSIFDRGKDAILPLVDELAEAKKHHHLVLTVGGGTRVRHTISIALDLGLPVGGVAQLVGAMEELNAILLNALLARHGSMPMQRDHFWDLPLYFASGITPIAISVPPYHFWEPPPEDGPLPEHGSDFGPFQMSDVLGFKEVIYVKDERGLHDKDPKRHPDARFIPRITLEELLAHPLEENILDQALFRAWSSARNIRRIRIINGLEPGNLLAALRGEDVGTVITKEDAVTGERRTIESTLAGSTLTGAAHGIDYRPVALMPEVRCVKIGGQSIMDRGRAALFPVLEELVAARKAGIQVVIMVGGGTRARHIYSIASELEMPVGVVATLGKYIPMQNARMVQMLLASQGGLFILPDDFEKLPLYLQLGCVPVMSGMPPFGYWEKREAGSRIPPHRTDAGVFLSAEFLGAPRAIFIKDEDGLYTNDPKKDPSARHIPRISAAELRATDLPDVVVERVLVEYLPRARWCKELQIVNGLKSGEVARALRGESNGSIIHA